MPRGNPIPQGKERVPALEGWFSTGERPALIGSRCGSCGNYAFPRESFFCRNPSCEGTDFEEVPLSRTGKIWSYTNACYQPPAPYVAADPYVPFCIAAVELSKEQMIVMGQVVSGVDVTELSVGQEVELVLDVLHEDDEHEYLVWKWQPTSLEESRS
jgi:uncharacterized OB-fold protein